MTPIRRPGAGRPTAGMRPGEKSSEYQKLTVRLPEESVALLKAIARVVNAPAWRAMVDALRGYVGDGPVLSAEQRRAVRALLRLNP